jgi:hypothetical protein
MLAKQQQKHEHHTLLAAVVLLLLLAFGFGCGAAGDRRVTAKDLFSTQEMSLLFVQLMGISTNKTALIVKSVQLGDERALASR